MPERPRDQLDRVYIPNFWGMDVRRNPDSNVEYGIGELAVNIGRDQRSPLHPRRGLQRVMAEGGEAKVSAPVAALVVIGGGGSASAVVLDKYGDVRLIRSLL